MKIELNLTKNEIRALFSVIDENPCEATCVWEECKNKRIDCDTCPFTKAQESLVEKLERAIDYYDIIK